jgi:hypothetical protein
VNTFGRMCGIIDPRSCIRQVLGFGIKTGYGSCLGNTRGGGNSDLLGWIQGQVGIWPKAKIEKRKNPFKF